MTMMTRMVTAKTAKAESESDVFFSERIQI